MAADPYAGEGYEIDAISAVLIGGTPMLGGQGTIVGTVMGLVFITLIKKPAHHLSINSYIQQLITALLIRRWYCFSRDSMSNLKGGREHGGIDGSAGNNEGVPRRESAG
jgi:ribose/xylose/arabinose/galactoside ABC-type transport system permease subunit